VLTHLHTSPYLIVGSEKTLLFDGGAPLSWPMIEKSLDTLLDGRDVDYLVPSHPEVAHCGNLHRLMRKYPNAELIGDVRDYPYYFPTYTTRMRELPIGTEIDLGSHRLVLVDPVIKDLPSTQWGYEATQQVLFVSDGFGYAHQPPLEDEDMPTHAPGECALFSSELSGEPGPDQIVWITKAALYWTRFVRMDIFLESFEDLLREYPPKLVAPAHGAVIDDMDKTLWTVWEALGLAYDPEAGVKQAGVRFID
jgi:glyoxylase-like metal-dependent hydrolase (beta-lactamase superfamily II)